MEEYDEETFESHKGGSQQKMLNNNSTLNGGMELKSSFFEYITSISSNEKAQMLNMLQYGGLAILPLLVLALL